MAVSETAKLIVDLSLKGNFARQMAASTKALDKFTAGEGRAYKAGAQIGTGIKNLGKIAAVGIGVLASQVALGLDSLIKLEKATAQTEAVIKSTGGAAGVTAAQVGKLAEKFESMNAIVGDEFIRAGENMLLTFTNIRGKAFEPALQAILDMNTAMGKGPEGLTTTAIQVGKALNDPVAGITALRKAGVNFTEKQKAKIKSLVKEGKLYEAQKIVLAELNKEFGDSFAKQGGTTAAKVAKFGDAIEDLQRTLAAGLLPVVSNVADALSELLADDEITQGVKDFGEGLAKVLSPANIKQGIGDLRGLAKVIGPAFSTAASAIGSVIDAFGKLPPDLRNLLIGAFAVNKVTGGLVTNVAGGLASALGSALKTIYAGNVTVVGAGAGGVPGAAGGGIKGLIKATIVGAVIVEGFSAWAQSITPFIEQNNALGAKGLTPGEIEAQKYYTADKQTQQLIFQRLGRIPTEAEWLSGQSKLNPKGEHTGAKTVVEIGGKHFDTMEKQYAAIEGVRAGIESVHVDTMDTKIIAAAQARTAGEAKQSMDAGLIATGLAAKRAGDTSASATRLSVGSAATSITSAIRANRPITNVSVHVNATTVSKSVTVVSRYGPTGGSADRDRIYEP